MADSSSSSAGGIGFTGALTITFIVLKLTGVIHWPWLWVLAPIWIAAIFAAMFITGAVAVAVVVARRDDRERERRRR